MNPLVRRSAAAIGATTIALGLTAGLASSAYAERLAHQDAAGDIHKTTWDSEGDTTDVPARNAAQPDIRRVVVRYQQNRILIRVKHTELSRRAGRYDVLRLRTPMGGASGSFLVREAGAWQGIGGFYRLDDRRPCAGVVHRFDYEHDLTTWSVPASCFGSPRWVRIGMSGRLAGPNTPEKYVLYGDSAFATGDPATENTLSRRIRRG